MPGFWRKCRITFRCVRITLWILVLAVIGLFFWCNRIGLPGFLKTRLVTILHERGVDLEFSRMRLNLVRGIVAENVHVGRTGTNSATAFTARQVQLDLDYSALFRQRRLELDGLELHDAAFTLDLSPTNTLTLTNLQTELRFGNQDTWLLDHFHADFDGTQIGINGEVVHAPQVRSWPMFAGNQTNRGSFIASLNLFADKLRQIHFEGRPQLLLNVSGDARNVHSMLIRLRATGDGVRTPWFAARGFQASAHLTVPAGAATNAIAGGGFWTNLQPFRLVCSVKLDAWRAPPWNLKGQSISCAGLWDAPTLALQHLSAHLGGGSMNADAALNLFTRVVTFTNTSDFDLHTVASLLTEKARHRLTEISWSRPPELHARGSLRLPPWTNDLPVKWRRDIEPSVQLSGELALTNATIAGVNLDDVHTHFRFNDLIWNLPDLTFSQHRTRLRLSGKESEVTKDVHFRVAGQLDQASVKPLLPTAKAVHAFEKVRLHQPLHLSLHVSGNLRKPSTFAATGHVALTNFAVRGQSVDSVAGDLFYTNLTMTFYSPELLRADGSQRMTADRVFLDFRARTIRFTNGWSTAEPEVVARAIGPKTGHALEPFHFLTPPLVHVNGTAPMHRVDNSREARDADLTFKIVRGVPLRWGKLHATNLTGTAHWLKESLLLTNLEAQLYEGTGRGSVGLDFRPRTHDFDYDFFCAITNVNLHLLARDISSETHLEGRLSGRVTVTNASSDNWRSVNGYGRTHVRDGLLWDVPMFAFMSPILNAVSPGLGNSRAKEATAAFVISNGVIQTDSLLISSTMMRLQYSGSVDLKENVDAKVTAQLLHNTPVIGPLFSAVLWPVSKIFECHVTGHLQKPKVKPIYIPKILLMPLHPIRSLEELFSPSSGSNPPTGE